MKKGTGSRVLAGVFLGGLVTGDAQAADFAPAGANFLVNTTTAKIQGIPAIAMDDAGNFVVAWINISFVAATQGVFAQRFDPTGNPIGTEFRVDDAGTTVNGSISVGMNPTTGDFVITWFSGQDLGVPADAPGTGLSFGIFAKRYDASGNELALPGAQGAGVGNEFQVNTTINGAQRSCKVAMDASGGFVVVWEDQGCISGTCLAANNNIPLPSADGSGIGIFGQRFDSSGTPVGGEFQVNDFTAGNQTRPSLAVDDAGNFLVAWTSDGQDGSSLGVFAKRYDNAGNGVQPPAAVQGSGVGNEFQINTTTAGVQFAPSVALHSSDGRFVIGWGGVDSFAKRYNASGNELAPPPTLPPPALVNVSGNEFRVNTFLTGAQVTLTVAMDLGGDFAIVWESAQVACLFAKKYDEGGNEVVPNFDQRNGIGNEFQVSEFECGTQTSAEAAMSPDGDFVIVWEELNNGRDGDLSGVFAQRYAPDADADGVPDETDVCPGFDDTVNGDSDAVPDGCDNCVAVANDLQANIDGDAPGDLCDACPADALNACDPGGSTADEVATETGGTVATADGALTLNVPPDSLPEDTTISVTQTETLPSDPPVDVKLTSGNGIGLVIAEYDLQPDGTTFDPPATLIIMADVSSLNATQRSNLNIYVFDSNANGGSGAFVPDSTSVCNVVEAPAGTFLATCTVSVSHFSRYATVAPTDTDGDGVADLFPPEADNCPVVANLNQEDCDNDGEGDHCDPNGPTIESRANKHTVGSGSHPGSTKEPLVGILVGAYDKSDGSCARQQDQQGNGISWQEYAAIVANCSPEGTATTDSGGVALITLPPGDYVVITHFDSDGDDALDQYLGVSASNLVCGELKKKHLQLLQDANGNKKPGKTTRLTGSELLIIEPEYVLWDATEQPYPFVFETVGDWGVSAAVAPPEGFVADYDALSAYVDNETKAVQFIITEVGSDLVPTQTAFQVTHKGQFTMVRSSVGIMLTPGYAQSRGFNVAQLRAQGLIKERPGNQGQGQDHGNPHGQ